METAGRLLKFLGEALRYILSIELVEIPFHIAAVAVAGIVGYTAAMLLIGFPVSIWEHFSKKKVNSEKEKKVIRLVTIIVAVAFILTLISEKIS